MRIRSSSLHKSSFQACLQAAQEELDTLVQAVAEEDGPSYEDLCASIAWQALVGSTVLASSLAFAHTEGVKHVTGHKASHQAVQAMVQAQPELDTVLSALEGLQDAAQIYTPKPWAPTAPISSSAPASSYLSTLKNYDPIQNDLDRMAEKGNSYEARQSEAAEPLSVPPAGEGFTHADTAIPPPHGALEAEPQAPASPSEMPAPIAVDCSV